MLKQVIDLFELLDRPDASATAIKAYLLDNGECDVETVTLTGENGTTDHIKITIPGYSGRK